MSTKILSRVWDSSQLKGTNLLALISLADQANDQGLVWPSIDTIAQRCRITARSASRVMAALEKSGEVFTHRRPGLHNVYVVKVGMGQRDFEAAAGQLNVMFPIEGHRVTPDEIDRGSPLTPMTGGETPVKNVTPDTDDGGQPPDPLTRVTSPPDTGDRRSNTVVVVEPNTFSDLDDQQQQRDPTAPEREAFNALKVPETIWRGWMGHEAELVLACVLHVQGDEHVRNPVGLLRHMIERDAASPAPKYVRQAREALVTTEAPENESYEAWLIRKLGPEQAKRQLEIEQNADWKPTRREPEVRPERLLQPPMGEWELRAEHAPV